MKQQIYRNILIGLLALFFLSGCKKDWLDQKPNSGLVTLSTLSDYQALLDVHSLHEYNNVGSVGELGGDNVYIPFANQMAYLGTGGALQSYIWGPDLNNLPADANWQQGYSAIYTCNVALDGLSGIERTSANSSQWDQLYGTALFFRAYQYASLAGTYMKPYDSSTVNKDLGIPLRLTQNITSSIQRGTASQVYSQIIADLQQASQLLFDGPQQYQQLYEPTKTAAYSMLARIYLSMGNYSLALKNVEDALKLQHTLLNYNSVPAPNNTQLSMPPWYQNPEVIFYAAIGDIALYPGLIADVDTVLYRSYDINDLRKQLFFDTLSYKPDICFRGSYSATSPIDLFSAPAVDELYLIRAECKVRLNDIQGGMDDLNDLLITRWKTGTFIPFIAATADDALRIILTERRKELVMRGVRWSDLRRLNKDSRFQTTIIRYTADGAAHTLKPNSNLYVWPIPQAEITATGIPQNPR